MTTAKIKGLRWWMMALLMTGSIINYLTRSSLSVAAPTLLQELQISTREYSWIVGAFQGAYMLQPLCGYVLDVLGLRLGFALFAIAWSLVGMAHAFAHDWQARAARSASSCSAAASRSSTRAAGPSRPER